MQLCSDRLLRDISWTAIKALIRVQFPSVQTLSIAALADWTEQDARPLLLDARTLAEYQVSHLPNARLAPSDLSELRQLEPSQPIVVYCSVGYRSAKLATKLQAKGFEPVFNLEGSIFAWANAGYPVYQGNQQVNCVHPYNAIWGKLLNADLRSY